MSTITAVLEADADGTLHLEVPEALRCGRIKVTATLEAADVSGASDGEAAGRRKAAIEALRWLRQRGTFRDVDPVAWQREMRQDRPLVGREDEAARQQRVHRRRCLPR